MVSENRKKRYWQPWEFITIGTFAALIKISTMLIAIAGGGMNPVSPIGKNVVATALKSLRLPLFLYLPAVVMIRFIPSFINDIKQVTEVLKIRGYKINPASLTLQKRAGIRNSTYQTRRDGSLHRPQRLREIHSHQTD
ncbi:MAG: hypothetical protein U9N19_10635 [Thermodesulfobacteriota bacterium]|nr:hypothetical protein [Thermodesulfobacteriota bacterium]